MTPPATPTLSSVGACGQALARPVDVTKADQFDAFVNEVVREWGVDILLTAINFDGGMASVV